MARGPDFTPIEQPVLVEIPKEMSARAAEILIRTIVEKQAMRRLPEVRAAYMEALLMTLLEEATQHDQAHREE